MSELFEPQNIRTAGISLGGRASGDITVDYVPEAMGDRTAQGYIDAWERTFRRETEESNRSAADLMAVSRPVLRDIRRASECIPGMTDRLILHSGPPAGYSELGERIRKTAAAAAVYERWAGDRKEAERMLEEGLIRLDSADNHSASAVKCGVISPGMPVFRVTDSSTGAYVYAPASIYGRARSAGNGCSEGAEEDLVFAEERLVPVLSEALLRGGAIDIFSIAREGMRAGDDCCLRTSHSALLFRDTVIRELVSSGGKVTAGLLEYLGDPDLFLEIFTAAVKVMLAPARPDEGCSFITSFCCNGRTAGIRIAGRGDRWITAELGSDEICGDEIVCELAGAGSAALCSAPAAAEGTGLGLFDMLKMMYDSYEASEQYISGLDIPYSGYGGSPLFTDFIRMCRTSSPLRMMYRKEGKPVVRDLGMTLQTEALRLFVSER